MKRALKAQPTSLFFNVRVNDNHLIGTRHWMLRVQFLPEQLKKDLAQIGLFGEGAINMGQDVTPPNVSKIMPESLDDTYQLLTKTPYTYDHNGVQARVFLLPDGTNYIVNDLYVKEVEDFFSPNKKKPTTYTWFTQGGVNPAIYGERLALVLPYRMGSDHEYKVNTNLK
jgi:hypothetical protein